MINKNNENNLLAFWIIEVLVAILIFSLGLSSIYLIIVSTLKLNDYNKNYIIASNLAREQIDLLRNIRDSNYKNTYKWNYIPNFWNNFNNTFTWGYYTIENNFSDSSLPTISLKTIANFWEWKTEINGKINNYRLYLDWEYNYTYNDNLGLNKKTKFFKFLEIKPLTFKSWSTNIIIRDAFKVKSKVIWTIRWYNEIEINTVIADWKRL